MGHGRHALHQRPLPERLELVLHRARRRIPEGALGFAQGLALQRLGQPRPDLLAALRQRPLHRRPPHLLLERRARPPRRTRRNGQRRQTRRHLPRRRMGGAALPHPRFLRDRGLRLRRLLEKSGRQRPADRARDLPAPAGLRRQRARPLRQGHPEPGDRLVPVRRRPFRRRSLRAQQRAALSGRLRAGAGARPHRRYPVLRRADAGLRRLPALPAARYARGGRMPAGRHAAPHQAADEPEPAARRFPVLVADRSRRLPAAQSQL